MARLRSVTHETIWHMSKAKSGAEATKYLKEAAEDCADMWEVPISKIKTTDLFWDNKRKHASAVIYVP